MQPEVNTEDNPPLIRFEPRFVENEKKTIETGKITGTNILIAYVRGHGDNKCEVPRTAEKYDEQGNTISEPWLQGLRERLHAKQITDNYFNYCKQCLDAYKSNSDIPIIGTPIKLLPKISPFEAERLVSINIFTIESCAEMTEDAMQSYGMGGRGLKDRARAYVNGAGPDSDLVAELAALKAENELLKSQSQPDIPVAASGLEDKTVDELVEIAKANGITQAADHWKRDTLIKKINEA